MISIHAAALAALTLAGTTALAETTPPHHNPFPDAPAGFFPPPLHPDGVTLHTKRLGPGVYALVADRPPVDNSGFIVGDDGVLVIDSHISPEMATQIIDAVRSVTSKPILYLVNTNFHGDHTFGNATFPASTIVVSHRATNDRQHEFDAERELLLPTVNNDHAVFAGVTLRLADITFEESITLDLGGRTVEVHHFGKGNTPGDAVVYEPLTRTAWTGNLVMGEGVIPFLIEAGAGEYITTLARFASKLSPKTIVPSHGIPTTGAQIDQHISYLNELVTGVKEQVALGKTEQQTLRALTINERWLPGAESPLAAVRPLVEDSFHPFNVAMTYRELTRE